MRRWVVDASPLIFLAKVERLPLLQAAADEVLVPEPVLLEVRTQDDIAATRIDEAVKRWLRPVARSSAVPELVLGEVAVIELAIERHADRVVLDDFAARRQARARGLAVVGTLGLLLAARLRGEIPDLRQEIDRLAAHGFRASRDLVQRILAEAGEH